MGNGVSTLVETSDLQHDNHQENKEQKDKQPLHHQDHVIVHDDYLDLDRRAPQITMNNEKTSSGDNVSIPSRQVNHAADSLGLDSHPSRMALQLNRINQNITNSPGHGDHNQSVRCDPYNIIQQGPHDAGSDHLDGITPSHHTSGHPDTPGDIDTPYDPDPQGDPDIPGDPDTLVNPDTPGDADTPFDPDTSGDEDPPGSLDPMDREFALCRPDSPLDEESDLLSVIDNSVMLERTQYKVPTLGDSCSSVNNADNDQCNRIEELQKLCNEKMGYSQSGGASMTKDSGLIANACDIIKSEVICHTGDSNLDDFDKQALNVSFTSADTEMAGEKILDRTNSEYIEGTDISAAMGVRYFQRVSSGLGVRSDCENDCSAETTVCNSASLNCQNNSKFSITDRHTVKSSLNTPACSVVMPCVEEHISIINGKASKNDIDSVLVASTTEIDTMNTASISGNLEAHGTETNITDVRCINVLDNSVIAHATGQTAEAPTQARDLNGYLIPVQDATGDILNAVITPGTTDLPASPNSITRCRCGIFPGTAGGAVTAPVTPEVTYERYLSLILDELDDDVVRSEVQDRVPASLTDNGRGSLHGSVLGSVHGTVVGIVRSNGGEIGRSISVESGRVRTVSEGEGHIPVSRIQSRRLPSVPAVHFYEDIHADSKAFAILNSNSTEFHKQGSDIQSLRAEHVQSLNACSSIVQGVTELLGRIYVVCARSSVINVYDASTLERLEEVNVTRTQLLAKNLAPCCSKCRCLYVYDRLSSVIWRVMLDGTGLVQKWLNFRGSAFSVTADGRILLLYESPLRLLIYRPDTRYVQTVPLRNAMTQPLFALETPSGEFIITEGIEDDAAHRVCEVNKDGEVVWCHGGQKGTGEQQLNYPAHATVDGVGHVYVADDFNHRVLVLDSRVGACRILIDTDIVSPHRLHFSVDTGRLIVGLRIGRVDIYNVKSI